MTFVWQDLIDRARVYIADDQKAMSGFIAADKWMLLAQVEYANLYRKWVRMGLVRPQPTATTFTTSTTINGVLAVVGVGEDLGNSVRLLYNAQVPGGADPFWQGSTPFTGKASEWAAHGAADNLLIELNPPDSSTTYTVKYIPTVPYATDATTTIDLPYGGDERLVLGLARRALVKESSRSQQLEELMREADAEMSFTAMSRIPGGPRVRRKARQVRTLPQRFSSFPTDPGLWLFV